jgi:hypothetical protein
MLRKCPAGRQGEISAAARGAVALAWHGQDGHEPACRPGRSRRRPWPFGLARGILGRTSRAKMALRLMGETPMPRARGKLVRQTCVTVMFMPWPWRRRCYNCSAETTLCHAFKMIGKTPTRRESRCASGCLGMAPTANPVQVTRTSKEQVAREPTTLRRFRFRCFAVPGSGFQVPPLGCSWLPATGYRLL